MFFTNMYELFFNFLVVLICGERYFEIVGSTEFKSEPFKESMSQFFKLFSVDMVKRKKVN